MTNNHFDEDGLFSMYAITAPEQAWVDRELLMAAALAGDFGRVTNREAARLCFTLEAFTDPEVSPLPAALFAEPDRVAALYRHLLALLPEILADARRGWPRYGALWAVQDKHLERSQRLLAEGRVTLEEMPSLDLARVEIPRLSGRG